MRIFSHYWNLMLLFIGTYTRDTHAEGIYAFELSEDMTDIRLLNTNSQIDNPSYLLRHPNLNVLYCVNECDDFQRTHSGAVSAFNYDETGRLSLINQQSSLGADPCHLTISADGLFLLVSNYSGGSFTSFPLLADGAIGDFVSSVQHQGKSIVQGRQESAHVHSSILDSTEEHLIVADLGLDQIAQYPISKTGQVSIQDRKTTKVEAGAGPRLFATSSEYYFLINELNNTLTSYVFSDAGRLEDCHTCSCLPDDNESLSAAAHVATSQYGAESQQLYASNRGADSIGVFEVKKNGQLEAKQFVSTVGNHPRHFVLSPDETHLLVANKDSGNVVIFERDTESGELTQMADQLHCSSPSCILFV